MAEQLKLGSKQYSITESELIERVKKEVEDLLKQEEALFDDLKDKLKVVQPDVDYLWDYVFNDFNPDKLKHEIQG
jgi:predicted XRE-type DNA-binding protein